MKNYLSILTLFLLSLISQAQVGIVDNSGADDFDTSPVTNSAGLEVRSSSRGLLLPRLTTTAINNLTPTPGLMVFDTELKCFKSFANGAWEVLGSPCNTPPPGPNTPPQINGAVTIPTPIYSAIMVSPNYTWEDPDNPSAGQTETGSTYVWEIGTDLGGGIIIGASQFATTKSATIPTGSNGQVVRVCVTPSDGIDFGTQVCSDWVEVDTTPAICKTDLIISEYVEGGSNNKYIEIFNGTGGNVDLSNYTLRKYTNGTGNEYEEPLSGTLADGSTIVYSNSSASLYTGTTIDLNDDVLNYNGNDPIALIKGTTIIDMIGDPTVDNEFGKDVTLSRLSTAQPNATFDMSEWSENPVNFVDGLGEYVCAGGPPAGDPTIQFSESIASVAENGETTYTVTINLLNAGSEAVEVTIVPNQNGAELGTDYSTNLNSPITIPAGSNSATFTITAIDDTVADAGESVVFDITNVSSNTESPVIGSQNAITVSIVDDEIPPTPPNLVQNPGFETGDTTDWSTTASASSINTTDTHSGANALQIQTASSRIDTEQDIAIEGGETYTISFWYKVLSGDGSDLRMWSNWIVNSGTNASELHTSGYLADTTWTKFSTTLTAPANETGFHFEVRTYGTSTVVYDDFSVVKQ